MARPVDSDSAQTYERILGAARKQLSDHGPTRFSLRRIAREAEVGLGTLHYYFGNRDGLLEACLEPVYRGVEDGIGDSLRRLSEGASLDDVIDSLTREYLRGARTRKDEIRLRILHTMEHGELAPGRLEGEVVRTLDRVSRALCGEASNARIRLAAHSFQMATSRYALHTDHEVRRITGIEDVADAWTAIEDHLVVMVQGLFRAALQPEVAPAEVGESTPARASVQGVALDA